MPQVELLYSPRFVTAVEVVFEFVAQFDPGEAAAHVELIIDGLAVLQRHPQIGRQTPGSLRELVIGSGRRCYVVLYRYDSQNQRVIVLTVRHASQAGYRG